MTGTDLTKEELALVNDDREPLPSPYKDGDVVQETFEDEEDTDA